MAKDYAKASTKQKKQNKHSLWVGLLVFTVLAYFIFPYIKTDELRQTFSQKVSALKTHSKKVIKKVKMQQPVFEFYTKLPEGTKAADNLSPNRSTQTPLTPTKPMVQESQATTVKTMDERLNHHKYKIQVGSFKTPSDAENLKAELILKGFQVSISTYHNPNSTWYRVDIGPFNSLQLAKKKQLELETEKYTSLIKRVG